MLTLRRRPGPALGDDRDRERPPWSPVRCRRPCSVRRNHASIVNVDAPSSGAAPNVTYALDPVEIDRVVRLDRTDRHGELVETAELSVVGRQPEHVGTRPPRRSPWSSSCSGSANVTVPTAGV